MIAPLQAIHHLIFVGRRPDLAEPQLRLWIAAYPDSAEAHSLLGWALALQRRRGGVAAAERGVSLAPDSAYTHATLGELNLYLDRPFHAEKPLRRALELTPWDPGIHASLAGALLAQRLPWRWPEGLRVAEAGLALDPGHPGCARLRAVGLMRTFRFRRGHEAALHALQLDPEDSAAHLVAGWTHSVWGNRRAARASVREALRADPTNEAAEFALRQMDHYVRLSAAMVLAIEQPRLVMRAIAGIYIWFVVLATVWYVIVRSSVETSGDTISGLYLSLICLLCIEAWTLRVRITRFGREQLAVLRAPGALTRGERVAMRAALIFFLVIATTFACAPFGERPDDRGSEPASGGLPSTYQAARGTSRDTRG